MKKLLLTCTLLLLFAAGTVARAAVDEADWVRKLSGKQHASVQDGVILTAMLAGRQTLDYQQALAYLQQKNILNDKPQHSDAVLTAGQLALWVMRVKGYSGGVFYTLFKSRRYAHRELVYRGFIPGKYSEYHKLHGSELLAVISKAAGDVDLSMQSGDSAANDKGGND